MAKKKNVKSPNKRKTKKKPRQPQPYKSQMKDETVRDLEKRIEELEMKIRKLEMVNGIIKDTVNTDW